MVDGVKTSFEETNMYVRFWYSTEDMHIIKQTGLVLPCCLDPYNSPVIEDVIGLFYYQTMINTQCNYREYGNDYRVQPSAFLALQEGLKLTSLVFSKIRTGVQFMRNGSRLRQNPCV